VVGAMLLAFAVYDRPTRWRAAALGAVCGLAALARAELVLFVPLLAMAVCVVAVRAPRGRLLLAGIAAVSGIVVIAPWVGYNVSRFRDPTFISTNDGLALAGSNCSRVYSGHSIGLTAIDPPNACIDTAHPPPGDQSQVSSVW